MYRFREKTAISVENRKFFPSRVFCATAEWVQLDIGAGYQKLEL